MPRRKPPSRFIEPQMPVLTDEPPDGDDWQHEIKYDGYRTQIHVFSGEGRAYTRRGYDWSDRYALLVDAALKLPCESAILDGEVIVQEEGGRSDFHALRSAIAGEPHRLIFMAFDLLELNGQDLRQRPLARRRELLAELLGPNDPASPLQFSSHVVGGGQDFFAAVDAMGLEGIVSKRLTSRYRSGTSKTWLKVKTFTEEELVVIGTSKGDRAPVALLAREEEGELAYVGGAMVTLAQPERDMFWQRAEELRVPEPPIPMDARKETGWVRPEIRVRVKTLRKEEPLRHATVLSIIEPRNAKARTTRKPAKASEEPHLPKPAIDQAELRAYYERIAPVLLPFVARRPLNLLRCSGPTCWFQRNLNHPATQPGTFAPLIGRIPIQQKNGKIEDYLFVDSPAGIMACIDADGVEFHGWGSLIDDIEKPDRLVIDLDPDVGLGFDPVRAAAEDVRLAFASLNLKSFALLSGGKGIHIVVPITPRAEWPEVKAFALQFCRTLAEANPERFTVALPKAERRARIFLDYLRNQRTATAILPYSARARPGLPVAAPISWRELGKVADAAMFSTRDVGRLEKRAASKALADWGKADQVLPGL